MFCMGAEGSHTEPRPHPTLPFHLCRPQMVLWLRAMLSWCVSPAASLYRPSM